MLFLTRHTPKLVLVSRDELSQVFFSYDLQIADYPATVFKIPIVCHADELPATRHVGKEWKRATGKRAILTFAMHKTLALDQTRIRRQLIFQALLIFALGLV